MSFPTEQRVEAACPACRATGLVLRTVPTEIPHFGAALETVVRCPACGYRHADFMILEERPPARHTLPLRPETLGARVVRASSGTWSVPELGFLAEPTPRSESFVTNAEGVLDRVRDVLLRAVQVHPDEPEKQATAMGLLERLDRILTGEETATLVLEDPFGHSAIVHEAVRVETLSAEEAETLKTGYLVLGRGDLEDRLL